MKKLRKYHKWPSLIVGLFILLFCASGIVMNHRSIFASLDYPRWLMPADYHYNNWNLASVKGFLKISENEQLAYGNIGIWKTDKSFSKFTDFNAGFPDGIDHRKVFTMLKATTGELFAGTLFGLYRYNTSASEWVRVQLPESNPRIVKVLEKDGSLFVMSRSELWELDLEGQETTRQLIIPPSESHDGKAGLFRTMWVVHSGEIFGLAGKLVVDLVGLAVIFMTLTGFFYTFLPKFAKKIKEARRKRLQKLNRKTINWHTLLGVYGLPILLVTVTTGMFLRPPLLIPIANSHVAAIPGTILASENVWHDKLRDIVYDTTDQHFILSTSEGFYALYSTGKNLITKDLALQPPVSVMGINVFEDIGHGEYLVGSFSGLYKWNTTQNTVFDAITGLQVTSYSQGNPFGAIAVAGIYMNENKPVAILNYDAGWMNLQPHVVPVMPDQLKNQPISWWNLALEVHTGRIFAFMLGDFYILYVPLMGLTVLLIIITGFIMYWKSRKRKSKQIKHGHTEFAGSTQGTLQP